MNKIDELIQKLCPEGVEYRELWEIFDIKNGYTPSKKNADFWTNGTIPWFRMEDIRKNGRILGESIQKITPQAVKGGRLFPAGSLIIATTATIGEHALLIADSLANQQFTFLTRKVNCLDKLDEKFIFYYGFVLSEWCKANTNVSGFASVDMVKFKKFKFPIPPLKIQREIVDILDKFTQLEAELEAELEVRKRQYEHYRNQLLTFDDTGGVRWATLGEVMVRTKGTKITAGQMKELQIQDGPVRIFAGGKTFADVNYGDIPDKDVQTIPSIIVKSRGIIEFEYYESPFSHKNEFWAYHSRSEQVSTKFIWYLLKNNELHFQELGGRMSKMPQISSKDTDKYRLPIPPLAEQNRIVAILDKFDALVSDISIGLPAELAARRKQYEYYRSKLLTFPERQKEAAHV